MKATIKDVATLAGVSIATVSHVLNKTRFVSEETREKVEKAIHSLSYEKNYVGVSLRTHQSNMIALIVPILSDETSNQFFMQVMLGIESILRPENYMMVVSNSNNEVENEIALIKKFKQIQIDGLIVAPPVSADHSFIDELAGDVPIVFIDRKPFNCADIDCVLTDSGKAIYTAVTEQIRMGHKKIGLLGEDIAYSGNIKDRIEGYKAAMRNANLRDDYIYFEKGSATIQAGYMLAKKLFKKYTDLSSVFVLNNCFGNGTLQFLQKSGRVVPDDVNMTVFDDYEWNRTCTPSITSIMQDAVEIGRKAASVLLERIKNPQKKHKIYHIPSKLIIRDSWKNI